MIGVSRKELGKVQCMTEAYIVMVNMLHSTAMGFRLAFERSIIARMGGFHRRS